jgi:predicted membrane metal-binding protein
MYTRADPNHRAVPVLLGVVTMLCVATMLACDVFPALLPADIHGFVEAVPLALIALAYLLYQGVHRPPSKEWLKAVLLAAAFLFWSANQFWPNPRQATVFNDIAIALFVLDVFLVMIGWPGASPDESFAETYSKPDYQPTLPDQSDQSSSK